jgi:hypothetical protein
MSTFKKIVRIAKAAINEASKPESFVKGEEFEAYVRKYMFTKDNYKLLHQSHDHGVNSKDYVESSLLPDFKFQDLKTGRIFYVECKFRKGWINGNDQVEWCSDKQLRRYKSIDKNDAPVFIAFGVGDDGSRPHSLVLFNLSKVNWTGLYPSFLDKNSFYLKRPVYSGYLWRL